MKALQVVGDEAPESEIDPRPEALQRTMSRYRRRRVTQSTQEKDEGNEAVKAEKGGRSRVKRELNAREDIKEDTGDELAVSETRSRKRARME